MIKVSFEAENKTKLYEEIIGFLGIEAVVAKAKSKDDTVLSPIAGETPVTETVKKVRKSRKKAEVKTEKDTEERVGTGAGRPVKDAETKVAIKKGEIISKSAVSDALQKLNVAKGLDVCKSVLDEYDCKRVGDLPEESYKDFIASCSKNMA